MRIFFFNKLPLYDRSPQENLGGRDAAKYSPSTVKILHAMASHAEGMCLRVIYLFITTLAFHDSRKKNARDKIEAP